jgi:hypothetical protein
MLSRMLSATLLALIVGGIYAGTASAAEYFPPEYGRCVKAPTPKTGVFGNPVCTKIGGTKANEYEWFEGPGLKPKFKLKLKPKTTLTLTLKESLDTMTCTGLTGTGEYTTPHQAVYHGIKLTGCSTSVPCTSAGQAAGTIVTYESGLAPSATLGIEPLTAVFYAGFNGEGEWATFYCGGDEWVLVGGDPLGDGALRLVKPNKMLLKETGVWNQSEGNQIPQYFNGGFKQWHCVIDREEPEKTRDRFCGVSMSILQTNEEKMEINSVY